ncbi:MAG: sec-independent translocase [Nocardioides sp.]
MFGMGLPELTVILVVAVLVFGPDRLPELARQAGRFVRQARAMANSARDDLRRELGPEYADLELRDLDPRVLVRKHILDVAAEEPEAPRTPPASPRFAREPGTPTPFDPDST